MWKIQVLSPPSALALTRLPPADLAALSQGGSFPMNTACLNAENNGSLLFLVFKNPGVFSFLVILSCHLNLHNRYFSFIVLLLS